MIPALELLVPEVLPRVRRVLCIVVLVADRAGQRDQEAELAHLAARLSGTRGRRVDAGEARESAQALNQFFDLLDTWAEAALPTLDLHEPGQREAS